MGSSICHAGKYVATIMTTPGADSDEKAGIMTTSSFQLFCVISVFLSANCIYYSNCSLMTKLLHVTRQNVRHIYSYSITMITTLVIKTS